MESAFPVLNPVFSSKEKVARKPSRLKTGHKRGGEKTCMKCSVWAVPAPPGVPARTSGDVAQPVGWSPRSAVPGRGRYARHIDEDLAHRDRLAPLEAVVAFGLAAALAFEAAAAVGGWVAGGGERGRFSSAGARCSSEAR